MEPERFWQLMALMAEEEEGSDEAANEALLAALSRLPPVDILAFAQRFTYFVEQAYRTDLWGAGYLINGGCSDDGFHAFRCWLVSAGRQVYENALANADSLADVVDVEGIYAGGAVESMARHAWQVVTCGGPNEYYAELERLGSLPLEVDEGEDWDFDDDDEVRRRLPRLARMYLEGPGSDGK